MNLTFRPHHFLCTLGFQGKGYSPAFTNNYDKILQFLDLNEKALITVVGHTDSICGPCPHKRGKTCTKEAKIQALDQGHAHILKVKPGDQLSWEDGKQRLRTHMTVEAFHQVCQGCEWKSLGFCETALRNLHADDKKANA